MSSTEEDLYADYLEETFDYFNSDLKQLILHILLEGYSNNFEGLWIFILEQFLKGDYWKIEEISEEIQDTNDYGSVEDMVLNQVVQVIQSLELGQVSRIGVNHLSSLSELLVRKILKDKLIDNDEEISVGYYSAIISEIYDLKKSSEEKIHEAMKKGKGSDWHSMLQKIDFDDPNRALRELGYTCAVASSYIEIEVKFNDEKMKEMKERLDDYLSNFPTDHFIDKKPTYKKKRYYFSKQIENFYNYIKVLPVISGIVNIPFSSLEEQGFEVVKMMGHLERKGKIKLRNWNDVDMWNVKFHTLPITLESLVSSESVLNNKSEKSELIAESPKAEFTDEVLNFKDKKIDFRGKQNQKDLLKTLFKDPNKNWFYDEVQDDWDGAGIDKAKYPKEYWRKFYTAGDGINTAVAIETGVKDFIIKDATRKGNIRVNPKYIIQPKV